MGRQRRRFQRDAEGALPCRGRGTGAPRETSGHARLDHRGQPQDGFLRLPDIFNLSLNADLVVLSACQTGLGKDVRGEGLVGLTRGFMYSGAARVMTSLWKVDDTATAELMKYFYEAMLKDKQTPASALRTAQRRLRLRLLRLLLRKRGR